MAAPPSQSWGITHSHCRSPATISSTCFRVQPAGQSAPCQGPSNGPQNCLTLTPTPGDLENNLHRPVGHGYNLAKQQVVSSVAVYLPSSI
ncbi:hypothetical protein HO173_011169 [Letharia columbiana]|uniref:Uncharacterized protein n=1 Tax=Letharia columbiana TaxID=112416 RepID=A0A8H6FLB1_9LECA|nr:uncharacterized protein HO173_011169 [Letharia columbiana]KAF6230632.1 hypothetical protein HO173_011169 [Letharia columbiana]